MGELLRDTRVLRLAGGSLRMTRVWLWLGGKQIPCGSDKQKKQGQKQVQRQKQQKKQIPVGNDKQKGKGGSSGARMQF